MGTHDPAFGRIALLVRGLRCNGFDIESCVEPSWGSTSERIGLVNSGLRNPKLFARLSAAYARILRSLPPRRRGAPLLVGYPGQLDTVLLRMLTRRPIVLDGFVSIAETLADRGLASPSHPTMRVARMLDRLAFRLADLVIVDTHAHARRFSRELGLDGAKVVVVPVGAADPGPLPEPTPSSSLRVLYFGGFVPLHGVTTILEAARRIAPSDRIDIELVGDGQDAELAECWLASNDCPHVRLTRRWMPETELIARHIQRADVCLGIFGSGPKAMDVVPAKLYLGLACGRPMITADSPAVREELLTSSASDTPVLVCPPANPEALANAMMRLRDDIATRREIAAAGRALFEARFRPERIVAPLCERLERGGLRTANERH